MNTLCRQQEVGFAPRSGKPTQFNPLRGAALLASLFAAGMLLVSANCEAAPPPPRFALDGKPAEECGSVRSVKAGQLLSPPPFKHVATRSKTSVSGTWNGVRGAISVARASKEDARRWEALLASPDPAAIFDDQSPFAEIYLRARVRPVSFPWGRGFMALTMETQKDYVSPCNDMLECDVRGITADGRWLVSATFPVRHPQLPESWRRIWEDAGGAASDPDVRMLERAAPGAFSPSLEDIEKLLAGLTVTSK